MSKKFYSNGSVDYKTKLTKVLDYARIFHGAFKQHGSITDDFLRRNMVEDKVYNRELFEEVLSRDECINYTNAIRTRLAHDGTFGNELDKLNADKKLPAYISWLAKSVQDAVLVWLKNKSLSSKSPLQRGF